VNKKPANLLIDPRSQRLTALLSEIWYKGLISRAELKRTTGLTLASVTRLVQELKNAGVIIETDKGESSGGRQPSLIRVNPEAGVVIGLDFSGIELKGAIMDAANHCLNVIKQPFQGMQPAIIQRQVIQMCQELISNPVIQQRRVLGIGISVPGTVDAEKGIIRDSLNMRLHDFPIRDILGNVFALPVFIEHDTSTAALAEKFYGAGRGVGDLIYIIVSTGIGAGLIINHEVYRGATGLAGELGHVIVERDGQVCVCGKRGCLEAVAAVPAMLANAHNLLLRREGSSQDTNTISLNALIEAAGQGDRLALAIIQRAADYLAMAISIVVSIVDIRLMIIGGEVVQMGELYFTSLRKSIEKYRVEGQEIQVVPAVLGENAPLQGVSMIVLQNVFGR
jgi:predicted NBD/HSP70 family sugar kinase/biotin operon repressor